MAQNLIVSPSPHIVHKDNTRQIMLDVCLALMPALIASVLIFGYRAFMLTAVTVAAAVVFEYLYRKLMKKESSIGDCSAIVTGLLLAYNLPPTLPFWMAIIGAFIAIVIVKQLFGGIGFNFANPAIVGRIVLALSFTAKMTTYSYPDNGIDAFTSATPLAAAEDPSAYLTLFLGNHGGVLGETSVLALLIGGVYLVIRKVISPVLPITYVATVAVMSLLCGHDPLYQILSGGLMLGAIFMATDYTTSPFTRKGKLAAGIFLGVVTCLIRFFGNSAEGVSFAILLMNIILPYINRLTRQKALGGGKAK